MNRHDRRAAKAKRRGEDKQRAAEMVRGDTRRLAKEIAQFATREDADVDVIGPNDDSHECYFASSALSKQHDACSKHINRNML